MTKIQFLLGLKDNTGEKVRDDNLLNFYLSSITIPNFNYQPKKYKRRNMGIYEFANLLKLRILKIKKN